jgi:magnesium transporter
MAQVKSYHKALLDLLDDEDDIAFMSLTLCKKEPYLHSYLHSQDSKSAVFPLLLKKLQEEKEETISMMESYLDDYNTLLSQICYISYEIQNAEDLVVLKLDCSRNQLLVADTKLSVVSVSLALGSFISSMFGMNLINHFEGNTSGFIIVFGFTSILSIVVIIATILHFKRTNIIPK